MSGGRSSPSMRGRTGGHDDGRDGECSGLRYESSLSAWPTEVTARRCGCQPEKWVFEMLMESTVVPSC